MKKADKLQKELEKYKSVNVMITEFHSIKSYE